jgi:arylsulfatase A-like enzyme
MSFKFYAMLFATGVALGLIGDLRAQQAPNILLIIGDDMGVEALAAYGLGDDPPETAALDDLARDGVRFDNFWAQPVCSPTRATVITGRYGFRTGIGRPVGGGPLPEPPAKPAGAPAESNGAPNAASAEDRALPRPHLLLSEYTLPRALKEHSISDYDTAAFGKWHLAMPENGWTDHPNTVGFDHFAGLMGGGPESYFAWNKVINGEVSGVVGYTPTDKVDDALAWLDDRDGDPWLLWLAFNLGHTPLHLPPGDSWQSDYSEHDAGSVPEEHWTAYFNAMVEAMDTEIERLLDSLDPAVRDNTYVIFMGDNGTYDPVVGAPFRRGRAKGTIYEGGVNVPLIVSGPGVPRDSVSEALVNSTDLFATILEMAGVNPEAAIPEGVTTDTVSFMASLTDPAGPSAREWLYADEFFGGFGGVEGADYAMRNHRYKLLRFEGVEEFYDLEEDPYEYDNLLDRELTVNERAEYEALRAEIHRLRSSH